MVFNFVFKSFRQNASSVEKTEKDTLQRISLFYLKKNYVQDGNNVHVVGYQIFVNGDAR